MIKTLVTIGPNSLNYDDITKFASYTKLFRLNGSHSDIAWHKSAVKLIRSVCPDAFILIDIPGIKPRTANTENIDITKDQKVLFGNGDFGEGCLQIKLTKPLPANQGLLESFSLNDGQFLFDIKKIGSNFVVGKSRESFCLLPKKGINLPGSVYNEDKQYEIYQNFIEVISELDVDALGLSFVQTGQLVDKIRAIKPNIVLISKIENSEGLKNCSEIAAASDVIMIDRGDLVAEIGYENLFLGIEEISKITKSHGKPLIMATENLESMINRELPSKSEVISLAHSASIGVDCFMLSEETAISNNAHVIVKWLAEFSDKLPEGRNLNFSVKNKLDGFKLDIWKSVYSYPEFPVIIMSKSGRAVSRYLSMQPNADVFVITNNEVLRKSSLLYSNSIKVFKLHMDDIPNIDLLWTTIEQNKETIFAKNSKVMALYVSKYLNKPRVNSITIFEKSDFFG